jgi:hypothetical protein
MSKQRARTVAEYLAALPPERRKVIAAVRKLVRGALPRGYREGIGWGVISYEVPLAVYPDTYNGHPLCYVALAAQKNYYALYLMCVYGDKQVAARFKAAYKERGMKLDMGKSCVRFKRLEHLHLDAVRDVIAAVPMARYIAAAKAVKRK